MKNRQNLFHILKMLMIWSALLTLVACDEWMSTFTTGYQISGVVSGLANGQQIILKNNGSDVLKISANGTFTFQNAIAFGESYSVSVSTQPSSDKFQWCSIFNGAGSITTNVADIVVACGPIVSTLAGSGITGGTDGQGTDASFNRPRGMAFDSIGNLYVADQIGNKIRKIDSNGYVSTLAGSGERGSSNGQGTEANFNSPFELAYDNGYIYVTDAANAAVRKIDSSGNVTTFATPGYSVGIMLDKSKRFFYLVRYRDNSIVKLGLDGSITEFAGIRDPRFEDEDVDGPLSVAAIHMPASMALDDDGNLYVSEPNDHKIRKIDLTGNVTTFAGSGVAGYADGQGLAAQFNGPVGLSFFKGYLYVADNLNNRIRKIDADGNVTSFVGSGIKGSADGPGAEATFYRPMYVVPDGAGNFYVADTYNDKIRKISLPSLVK